MSVRCRVPEATYRGVQKVARVRGTKRSEAASFLLHRALGRLGTELQPTVFPQNADRWKMLMADNPPPNVDADTATALLTDELSQPGVSKIQKSDRPVSETYDFDIGQHEGSIRLENRRFFDYAEPRSRDEAALRYVADLQPTYYTPTHQKFHQRLAARYRFKLDDPERWFIPSNGAVAVDAGAYVGYTAIALHDIMGSDSKVIATEMVADNYFLLEKNIRVNGLTGKVDAHPYALSNERSMRQIASQGSAGNTHTIASLDSFSDATKTRASAFTLSDVLDLHHEIDHIDYLNVQVNGAELDVLAGLGPRWFPRVRTFYVLCPYAGKGVPTKDAVRRLLTEQGARIEAEKRGLLVARQ